MPEASTNADPTSGRPPTGDRTHARPEPGRARTVVEVVDVPEARVHHPIDLVGVVLYGLGVVLILALATYAQNTTSGVAEDVQGFATLLRRILIVPVAVLETVVTFVAPAAVLVELAIRRQGRQILEGIAAATASLLVCSLVTWVIVSFGTDLLVAGLSVRLAGEMTLTIPSYVALLAGLLTVTGPRTRRRSVLWSWNLVWITVGIMVITASVSLPGVIAALLVGRTVGLGVRYLSGVTSDRAQGSELVAGMRRAGCDPLRVVRVPDDSIAEQPADAAALPSPTPAAAALVRYSDNRVYEVRTVDGRDLEVLVLDGDRQVLGFLARLWRSLRLRGIDGRSVLSLRQAAERAALLLFTARAAGVRTPRLLGIAEAANSMLLVQEPIGTARPLSELEPEEVTDALLEQIWHELRVAQGAGLAHRALTSDVILVDTSGETPQVWLVGWEFGDVASSELARRMDITQVVALLALRVGPERAVESAVAVLPDADIAAIGPLLQTVTMPRRTREELRAHKEVLAQLRSALVARLPQADVEPGQIVRFGARTLLTVLLTSVAVIVLLTTINLQTILDALAHTDWRWSLLAFGLGMLTLFGAGLALVAFSPVKVPPWRATIVQSAATFVALAAPAGLGPVALNLRMLTRRGVSTSLAAATVALVQVSQFIVTVVMLLVLSIASGTNQLERFTVPPAVIAVLGVVALLAVGAMLVPRVRQWVASKSLPTLQQTWPRLIEILGQPWRLLLGIGGNAVITLGYTLAFDVCLRAFGQELSLVQVAVVYLAGNTAGSIAPTPGGIGTIEIALAGALTVTGVNPGVAASVAVLFRVLTYWLRIPFGYISMRYLRRVGEL